MGLFSSVFRGVKAKGFYLLLLSIASFRFHSLIDQTNVKILQTTVKILQTQYLLVKFNDYFLFRYFDGVQSPWKQILLLNLATN